MKSPLFQSKFYQNLSCSFICNLAVNVPTVAKQKIKKIKILKRKESNLFIPSKLHEAIKNADPERIKLTLQNIRWKIKLLNLKLIK